MRARRVAAVLRVRRLQEQRARGELAVGNAALHRAEQGEQAAITEVADRGHRSIGARTVLELRREHESIQAGFGVVGTRHLETEQRRTDTVELLDAWTVAARRVDALERLEERIHLVEAAEADRVERAEADDLAAERHRRRTVAEVSPDEQRRARSDSGSTDRSSGRSSTSGDGG